MLQKKEQSIEFVNCWKNSVVFVVSSSLFDECKWSFVTRDLFNANTTSSNLCTITELTGPEVGNINLGLSDQLSPIACLGGKKNRPEMQRGRNKDEGPLHEM